MARQLRGTMRLHQNVSDWFLHGGPEFAVLSARARVHDANCREDISGWSRDRWSGTGSRVAANWARLRSLRTRAEPYRGGRRNAVAVERHGRASPSRAR